MSYTTVMCIQCQYKSLKCKYSLSWSFEVGWFNSEGLVSSFECMYLTEATAVIECVGIDQWQHSNSTDRHDKLKIKLKHTHRHI